MLSFYIDYQVNESFLDTALEYENVRKLSSNYGYNFYSRPPALGTATFYVSVPANLSGLGPDVNEIPILKAGSEFVSETGVTFVLIEDVLFSNPKNEIVASAFSSVTGKPTRYAIRAHGQIKSTVSFVTNISTAISPTSDRADAIFMATAVAASATWLSTLAGAIVLSRI